MGFRAVLSTMAFALLGGCVLAPPYVPPEQGPTAQVRFSQERVGVYFYADEKCSKPSQLGEQRTVKVVAGEPIYLGMGFGGPGYTCAAYASFTPSEGGSYLVEYFEPDRDHCSISVERRGPNEEPLGQEPSRSALKC